MKNNTVIKITHYREFLTQNGLPTEYVISGYAPHLDFPHAMSASGYGTQIVPTKLLETTRSDGTPVIFAMRQKPVTNGYEGNTLTCIATILLSVFGDSTQEFKLSGIHAVWVGKELTCRRVLPEDGIPYNKEQKTLLATNFDARVVFQTRGQGAYHGARHTALYLYDEDYL